LVHTDVYLQIVHDVSMNMRDPEAVKAIADDLENVNSSPFFPLAGTTWSDLSLTNGYPSLLLLFSTLEKQGVIEDGDAIAHSYVLKIKEAIESEGLFHLSLFGGVSGICFALNEASCQGTRYQKMLNSLHSFLLDRIDSLYLAPLKNNQQKLIPTSPTLYDPVQGVCGIGRYALENLSLPPFFDAAENIAKALVALSRPLNYGGQSIPGWFLSPLDTLNARNRETCPKGNFNLGLAHGVTGILAYLSIAFLRGIQVEGQKEAIHTISEWIRSKAITHNGAILWPYYISWEEELEGATAVINGSKDAWCYGVPGVARTLFLAGKALDCESLKTFAADAYRGIFSRKQKDWHLPGPTLCHGISGLLLITHEMSKESGCEDLVPRVDELGDTLLSMYQPQAPWGFKDVEIGRDGKACELNKPGFLEGTAGVILALSSLSESRSNWHLPLLIHE